MARGGVREEQKDYDKAVSDYDEALRLDPKYPLATERLARAHEARGRAWAEKNDFDRAIADFGDVIRLDSSSTFARNFRGWAWTKKKQYGKAIADFDEALRIEPDDCAALNNAAWLRATCPEEHIRDGRAAVKMATKAAGLSGGESYAWLDTLAAACAEAGDFDAAVKHQNRAIDLNPRDEDFVKEAQERLALYKDHKPYREE
jgi:tetratricopeptide (TPR) repeat protein